MKALTLTQPWAQLVIEGVKRLETRSWTVSYRGPLAIHAARRWTSDDRAFAAQVCGGLLPGWARPDDLPRGVVLGVVELIDVLPAVHMGNDRERLLGDFTPLRFAWVLGAPHVFPNPFRARGALGLWEWTPWDLSEDVSHGITAPS